MLHGTTALVVHQPNPDFVRARDAEPVLRVLADEIDALGRSGEVYCAPCRWYGEFKPRVAKLVGWERHAPARPRRTGLMTSAGLDEWVDLDEPRVGDPWLYGGDAWDAVHDELFYRLAAFNTPGCACETLVEEAGKVSEPLYASIPRAVNLGPFLDGTYEPPTPDAGGERDDGEQLLLSGCWHSMIGSTGSAKTWWAVWHCVSEMRRGRTVAYAHFEESRPTRMIARLRALGCSDVLIRTRFVWLDCSRRWAGSEFAKSLPDDVALVLLDGINAACNHIGTSPDKPETVGVYRDQFVTPATRLGAAVLSLGHPPKARDRQSERHGFGSTAWLDEVDGLGFRMQPSGNPIKRGRFGSSNVYVVKDRDGTRDEDSTPGPYDEWSFVGSFVMDDTPGRRNTLAYMTAPKFDEAADALVAADALDVLGEKIVEYATSHEGAWESAKQLTTGLRAGGVKFVDKDVAPAVQRLADRGAIALTTGPRKAVGGRLADCAEADPFKTVS
jgi:hypothetical protein